MTVLQERMELMARYGLRLSVKELFGKADGGSLSSGKQKVRRVRSQRRPGSYRPHQDEATKTVAVAAGKAALALAPPRGASKALEAVADRFGVSATALRKWMAASA